MIWLLLVLYQIKHFVCDYPLQGKYMLGKFKSGWDWVLPLAAHAGVHGGATFLIALCVKPKSAFWIALFDMAIHFTMDRIKASPNLLGRFKALSGSEYSKIAERLQEVAAIEKKNLETKTSGDETNICYDVKAYAAERFRSNTYFWWALGLDQGVHHLTHYFIIWRLLS